MSEYELPRGRTKHAGHELSVDYGARHDLAQGHSVGDPNLGKRGPTFGYHGTFQRAVDSGGVEHSVDTATHTHAKQQRHFALRSCRSPAPQPSQYIKKNALQAEYAEQVWKLAARMEGDEQFREWAFREFNKGIEPSIIDYLPGRILGEMISPLAKPPTGQLRLALSIAHSFDRRDVPRQHGRDLMQKFLGKVYPDGVLGNVAHFFEAMGLLPFVTAIPMVGHDMARLASFGLSAFWDLGMSPLLKVVFGLTSPLTAWKYDSGQFADADVAGTSFGYDWLEWEKTKGCDR